MKDDKRDNLEIEYVDAEGLANTLDALTQICFAKAEHIRASYSDHSSACAWESIGRKLDTARAMIAADSLFLQGYL